MDSSEFFQEATLRICGSLEIEKALWDTYMYLLDFIPAAENIYLHYYDQRHGASTVFAVADRSGGRHVQLQTIWPDKWRRIAEKNQLPEAVLLNAADTHPLGKLMLKTWDNPQKSSVITVRLTVEKDWVGGVSLWAEGRERFTEENLNRFALLRKPFAIALSNSRRYQKLLEYQDLLSDDKKYFQEELRSITGDEIIGSDYGLRAVMERVRQVSRLDSPVLLLGETGVGKEIIANSIHNLSHRREGPFIKINCGAIPETLIDSELFGYEKGAFTGAVSTKRGRFERAHGGTVFLDEIGELPLDAQVRFLRVLQEKEIERVGGIRTIQLDIRVIAATHRDLLDMVSEGRFREDLYFRLNVFPIIIPPLKDRKGDISSLAQHFINKKAREMGLHKIPSLSPDALDRLKAYHWPGNIRELENAVERALILNNGSPLAFEEFELPVMKEKAPGAESLQINNSLILDNIIYLHIRKVLQMTGGKVGGKNGAAEILGVNPSTLRHKMRSLGISFGRKI